MTFMTGYYCLIQYCPDPTRLEAATIGVLLFCPEQGFLKARTAQDNRRIRQFFGREGHDWSRINSFKKAIEERLEVEQPEMRSVADLEAFIALRANQIVFTPPRAMRVAKPEDDLQRIFEEVVGGVYRKEPGRSFKKVVDERLRRAGLQRKLRRDINVEVPVFKRQVSIPYGFQNGRFNLIQLVQFLTTNADQAIYTACRYAAEGRSLWKNPHPEYGKLKLVIVGEFLPERPQTKDEVRLVFNEMDSHVDLFATSELDGLISEIRTTGKDILDDPTNATTE
ncbi:MAG: DUF3037 domain-containing protein [Pirellulales bacterium]|nr:DUF3037 domain-containing protein [Pirellulales bacterium]